MTITAGSGSIEDVDFRDQLWLNLASHTPRVVGGGAYRSSHRESAGTLAAVTEVLSHKVHGRHSRNKRFDPPPGGPT